MAIKKIIGIYKIVSPSGKIYIGQSWNIEARQRLYSFLACKEQSLLYRSLKKYGWSSHSFEIIHCLPPDILQNVIDAYEQLYMDAYKECGYILLNIRRAGAKGKHSEATKRLMAEVKKRENLKPETRKKLSEAKMGWIPSKETRQLWSAQRKGKGTGYRDMSIVLSSITLESRLKAAQSNRGQKRTEEQRKRMSDGRKRAQDGRRAQSAELSHG